MVTDIHTNPPLMLGLINVVEMFVRSKPLKANFEPKAEQYRILLLKEYENEHLSCGQVHNNQNNSFYDS